MKLPDGCEILKDGDRFLLKRRDDTTTEIIFSDKICKLSDIETIWEFRIPYQFVSSKQKSIDKLGKGDLKASRSSTAWLLRLHLQKFKIIPATIDRYGGFCFARCVSDSDVDTNPLQIQEVWLSSLWNEQNQMATDVLGFGLKPCAILSDNPEERRQAKLSAGQQLAESGGFLDEDEVE